MFGIDLLSFLKDEIRPTLRWIGKSYFNHYTLSLFKKITCIQ
jgi:hypothetical protein